MRLQVVLVLVFLLGIVALASAQEDSSSSSADPEGIPLVVAPQHMVTGQRLPLELEEVESLPIPQDTLALPATDACSDAPELDLPDGGQTSTNNMTIESNDPALSCMWGTPSNTRGHRTVWYKFTPEYSGWVTIDTASSTRVGAFPPFFDTVLAVYSGGCGALTQLACSDDFNGFTSRVSIAVQAGQTYYVEAADWQFPLSGDAVLNLSAEIEVGTNWEQVNLMAVPRSRHSTVVVGNKIFVIGGQVVVDDTPVRTPTTDMYDTSLSGGQDPWTFRAPLPGPDGLGYSNTTAAHVNGKIYVPAGFIGVDGAYDGTHWVYDISGNSWSSTAADPNNWPGGEPAIYSASVSDNSGYYLIGGLTGPMPLAQTTPWWEARREMYFYSPVTNIWFDRPPMNTGRFGHVAARQIINGTSYICVIGGIGRQSDDSPILLSSGECYSEPSGQWNLITGPLNYPRYYAASAVGLDGTWYVFGGTDANGNSVPVTEVYDRFDNSWTALDVRFDLGTFAPGQDVRPPRGWPRGGFVGQTLFAIGGEQNTQGGSPVVNLVERLYLPQNHSQLPFIANTDASGGLDNTFASASQLLLNQPQSHRFTGPDDYFDVFFFQVPSPRTITINVSQIPSGSDYDLYAYNDNKFWRGSSINPGNLNENLSLNLGAGRFYVVVTRKFPPPGSTPDTEPYRIIALG